MNKQPMVSVVLATRNNPQELANALRSLARQTYPNFEVLVVNNGDEDIRQLVKSILPEQNTTYIQPQEKLTPAAARNAALRVAKGVFITYLDESDSYYPHHIEQLAVFLSENPNIGAAYTSAHLGRPFVFSGGLRTVRKEELPSKSFDRMQLLISNYIPLSCMMHRVSCLEQAGIFDEKLTTQEDWDLWIRISKLYPIRLIPVATVQISNAAADSIRATLPSQAIDALLTIYRKHEKNASENMLLAQMRMHHIIHLYRNLAEQHERNDAFDKAEHLWQRIAELSGRPEDLLRLGIVRRQMGKDDQARLTLNLAKKLRHSDTANGN